MAIDERNKKITSSPNTPVEERIETLEILIKTLMFVAFEDQPQLKYQWAHSLHKAVELRGMHQTLPAGVLHALQAHADGLVAIDKYADWLKGSLRPP